MTDVHELAIKHPKMLIADDDPSVVKLLADRCRRVGSEVETASNGVQALIKANRNCPDVMVIDVNMPEADGLTVCARLLDPTKRSLNVIVVTGSRETETVDRCEGFGAFYIRKGPEFWNGLAAALIDRASIHRASSQHEPADARSEPGDARRPKRTKADPRSQERFFAPLRITAK